MTELTGVTIAFLNNFPGPGLGGGEVNLMNIVVGCVEAGMDVRVLCPPGVALAEEATAAGAESVACDFSSTRKALRSVRRHLRERPARIVNGTGFLTNQVARHVAPRETVVVNSVQVMPDAPVAEGASAAAMWLRRRAERSRRGRVDAFVAVSQTVAEALVVSGADESRVHVVRNGIDAAALAEAGASSDPGPLPAAPLLVGVVARLEPVKGVETFVRAAGLLAATRSDVSFVVAGDGSQRAELEALATSLHLGERLVFLGRALGPAVLSKLDIVVVPSLSEGFGIAALEAMALGKPVVASGVDGLKEVVADGVTGLLVPPKDPPALSGAISRLLDDAATRHSMAIAGRDRAVAEFSVAVMRERYLGIYEDLLAKRAGSAT